MSKENADATKQAEKQKKPSRKKIMIFDQPKKGEANEQQSRS